MTRRFLMLVILGIILCAEFSPLAARLPTAVEGQANRSYWQLLFLYDSTKDGNQSEWFLHPFYSSYSNSEKAYQFKTVLYPIFWYHGTNYWRKWTFAYFFTGDSFYHEDTAKDDDIFLSPLLYWGSGDTDRERYFSIFPFYGSINNKLGWSEISYVMFPIYTSWSHKEYKARSILWPLIMWGSGSNRDDLRIFPFYSHKIHYRQYERYTVLWPFLQWGREDIDKKDPRSFFYFFPFFARKRSQSDDMRANAIVPLIILPPLISWGYDKKTNGENVNILSFIYQYGQNDDPYIRKHILFPIVGTYSFGMKDFLKNDDEIYSYHFTFITPLYGRIRTSSSLIEAQYDYLIPFLTVGGRYYRKERENEDFLKIWPLFQKVDDTRGNFGFRSLVLWPGRADHLERNWGPYYSLVEYQSFENDDRYFSLLFRLYSQYWSEDRFQLFLLGFDYDNSTNASSFEFLGGFLGYRRYRNEEGTMDTDLRLLWFSI